ncbi:MAG: 30S ribosomal protein S6 [Chloroflexi bacterium]|nr:30S ribosomal protein S6 [Chloroflexota bacterium]
MDRREGRGAERKGGGALPEYELMFILPPNLEEQATNAATERVRSYVAARGGEVQSHEPWGRRRLAYPIRKHTEGMYHVARITLGPDNAIELDRALRLNEQILRHLIVRADR